MKVTKFIIAIVSTLILTACSNKDEQLTNEELQESSLESIELIVENTEGFIYGGDDPNIQSKFFNLSSDELPIYFELLADKIAVDMKNYEDEYTFEELQSYYFNLLKLINEFATKQFSRKFNNITMDEFFYLLDEYGTEISEDILDNMSSKFLEKREESISKKLFSVQQKDSFEKSNCSEYSFPVQTHFSLYGGNECQGYSNATYPNGDDCDYEFIFDWDKTSIPDYSIGLRGKSIPTLVIVAYGRIEGRVNEDDKTIRFLIGSGRIDPLFTNGASSFYKTLNAKW